MRRDEGKVTEMEARKGRKGVLLLNKEQSHKGFFCELFPSYICTWLDLPQDERNGQQQHV